MTIIWGYSSEDTLSKGKEVGKEVIKVKQIFSALLFREGIKGMSIRIESFEKETEAVLELIIDDETILSSEFSPSETGDLIFEIPDKIIPQTKIEIIAKVTKGALVLPISSIGNGMGFHMRDDSYIPTTHLGLGILLA